MTIMCYFFEMARHALRTPHYYYYLYILHITYPTVTYCILNFLFRDFQNFARRIEILEDKTYSARLNNILYYNESVMRINGNSNRYNGI